MHVHTTDDQTIEGTLVADGTDGLVLTAATLHDADGPVPMAGEVFIPRGRVSFVQVVDP